MIRCIGRVVLFLLFTLPAIAWAARPGLTDGAALPGEDGELVVFFPPAALQPEIGGRPVVLQVLEAAHPQLKVARADAAGMYHFMIPESDAAGIAAVRATVSKLGGVTGKTLPGPATRALQKAQLQASRMGRDDVLGLIVRYRDPAKRSAAAKNSRLEQADVERITSVVGRDIVRHRAMSNESYVALFDRPADLVEGERLAQRLAMDPAVESVELDVRHEAQRVPNDEFFTLQWNLTSAVAGIRAPQAWDITTGSAGIVVGVVDTGYVAHPDLVGRVLPGADTITDPTRARDGGGRDADPTDLGDFSAAGDCGAGTSATNSSWHGTHVMGIIGANANNGIGIAGIDWSARLVPVRALGRCGGDTADIVDGITWAAGVDVPGLSRNPNPARVINMSLRGPGACTLAYDAAIAQAMTQRAIVVVAAGNDNASGLNFVPAGCAMTMTVTAVGPTGDKAPYSNFGAALEISAPGGDTSAAFANGIPSTLWTGTAGAPGNPTYVYYQGTSQATPHVAGTASLMLSVAPSLSVAQMRTILEVTSSPFPAGSRCATKQDCGAGIVNAAAAVDLARRVGSATNYTDTFYNPAEPGWGLTMQHEGDTIFGAWYNYAPSGKAVWYFMSALARQGDDVFFGDIYVATSGTPFNLINGAPSLANFTKVGSIAVSFLETDHAWMLFTLNGTTSAKHIYRFPFSTQPTCSFATGSRAALTNYQDLWWNQPERGWGLNLSHQGDQIFAAWFTYGSDGAPMWLVGQLQRTSGNNFTGSVFQTTGVPAETTDNQQVSRTITSVGTMTLAFSNGENGTFSYTVFGQSGSKPITRQVFSSPLTSCH
jgi:serine protease